MTEVVLLFIKKIFQTRGVAIWILTFNVILKDLSIGIVLIKHISICSQLIKSKHCQCRLVSVQFLKSVSSHFDCKSICKKKNTQKTEKKVGMNEPDSNEFLCVCFIDITIIPLLIMTLAAIFVERKPNIVITLFQTSYLC